MLKVFCLILFPNIYIFFYNEFTFFFNQVWRNDTTEIQNSDPWASWIEKCNFNSFPWDRDSEHNIWQLRPMGRWYVDPWSWIPGKSNGENTEASRCFIGNFIYFCRLHLRMEPQPLMLLLVLKNEGSCLSNPEQKFTKAKLLAFINDLVTCPSMYAKRKLLLMFVPIKKCQVRTFNNLWSNFNPWWKLSTTTQTLIVYNAVVLDTPMDYSLDDCIEYIQEDELVEVTPKSVRMSKNPKINRKGRWSRSKTGTFGWSTFIVRIFVLSFLIVYRRFFSSLEINPSSYSANIVLVVLMELYMTIVKKNLRNIVCSGKKSMARAEICLDFDFIII